MRLIINGEEIESKAATIQELVNQMGLDPRGLVVQLEQEIIERDVWQKTQLQEGNKVELLKFVGGGA